MAIVLLLCYTLLYIDNAAAKGISANNTSSADVVVLQPTEPLPADALKLDVIDISVLHSIKDHCYTEVVALASDMARKANANVVRLLEPFSSAGKTTHFKVAFYRASDIGPYQRTFSWKQERKLTWNDFKGAIPPIDNNTAATTYCGIGIETGRAEKGKRPHISVYNTFYTTDSWVRNDALDADILLHEQGHFDICELYTRILREKINALAVDPKNIKKQLARIYNEVNIQYQNYQQAYEVATTHGTDLLQQQKWVEKIFSELKEKERWHS